MDLTDSRGCTYVSVQLLGRIYPSWPWQNDATVVHDYAILMMMIKVQGQDVMVVEEFVSTMGILSTQQPEALVTSVANSPGLTRILRVSAFDLQSSGLVLQSPG